MSRLTIVNDVDEKSISSKVKRLENYINDAKKGWAGTDDEYRQWARKTARQGIENLAKWAILIEKENKK